MNVTYLVGRAAMAAVVGRAALAGREGLAGQVAVARRGAWVAIYDPSSTSRLQRRRRGADQTRWARRCSLR